MSELDDLKKEVERLGNPLVTLERDTVKDFERVIKERDAALLQIDRLKNVEIDNRIVNEEHAKTIALLKAAELQLHEYRKVLVLVRSKLKSVGKGWQQDLYRAVVGILDPNKGGTDE